MGLPEGWSEFFVANSEPVRIRGQVELLRNGAVLVEL